MSVQVSKPVFCQVCGTFLDGASCATNMDEKIQPQKGDVSMCVYCGTVSEYQEDLTLKPMSDKEVETMPMPPHVRWVLKHAKKIWEEKLKGTIKPPVEGRA